MDQILCVKEFSMRLAVAEMMVSPPLPAPLTYDTWMQGTQSLEGCKKARNIQWLYSLVSVQGDRSICVYQVPYVEALREAYREARMSFQQVWEADLLVAKAPQSFSQGAALIVVETNYHPPITPKIVGEIKDQAKGCLHELNIESVFSALTLDGTHSACTFSASSVEQVRSLYRKMGMPFEQVWKATLIQPIE
jgi:hypothetical protein